MNAPANIKSAARIRELANASRRAPETLPYASAASLRHIPGKKGLPFVGVLPEAAYDPLAFARRMHDRFGPVHRFHALGQWNVQLIGPDASELILFDAEKHFSAHHGWSRVLGPLFPGGLLLRDLEDHRVHRRAIGSAFKPEQVAAGLEIFEDRTQVMLERLSGTRFLFYRELREMALESAAIGFLGLTLGEDARLFSAAFKDVVTATVAILPGWMPGTSLHRGLAGRHTLDRFIRARIPERRAIGGDDLFSQLCVARYEDGQLLDAQEIIDHLIFVLAAAHDTLTSCLASTVYYLGRHPGWQSEIREEIRSSGLGRPADRTSIADLAELPVTEAVIKEALRLNTPAPIIWRRSVRSFEFKGVKIPAGTPTATNILLTHRLEEHWPDPERFDPTRFLGAAAASRHRFAWTPFGGGAHMCLGLHHAMVQAKSFLARLLAEHEICLDPGYSPSWYWWPNCRPLDGLPLTMRRLT